MSFWNAGPSHLCFLSAQHCIGYVLGTVKHVDSSKLIQTQPQVYDTPAQTEKLVSFFFFLPGIIKLDLLRFLSNKMGQQEMKS